MKKIGNIIFLHSIIFLYALSSVCAKFASGMEFFSFKWILLYGLQIFILGVYAILWQQVLKRMNLNFAYANKSLTLVWGMLFGFFVFKESISLFNILGAAIVLIGVIIMVTDEKNTDANEQELPCASDETEESEGVKND